jgi:hypothetical protein
MAGGLMQLVAVGVQDLYLSTNPQMSFFKVVYHRHTNFSMESVRQTFEGNVDFGKSVSVKIGREGDLLHHIMIELDIPAITPTNNNTISWVNALGHVIIERADFYIGELLVDRHYGEWLEIWSELTLDQSKRNGYNNMISKYESFTSVRGPIKLLIPLQFWFCRNIGLALPLVALQYHDIKLVIKLRPFSDLWTFGPNNNYVASQSGTTLITTSGPEFDDTDVGKIVYWADGTSDTINALVSGQSRHVVMTTNQTKNSQIIYTKPDDVPAFTPSITDARIYADFIYLESEERKKFAKNTHEYLIEQVQFDSDTTYQSNQTFLKVPIPFNLPIKQLVWVSQLQRYIEDKMYYNFSDTMDPLATEDDPIEKAVILFNGQERFEERISEYFRLAQPYYHSTRCPSSHIYTYNFAVAPEKHQPSGSANFSLLNTVDLRLTYKSTVGNSNVRVYGLNYNILKIQNGMGGILYAN